MQDTRKIVVIGATSNRADASNRCVRVYLEHGYKVFVVNPRETSVEGLRCFANVSDIHEPVAIAAFYVPAAEGLKHIHALPALGVRTVYFHPDAASGTLILRAQGQQMNAISEDAVRALGVLTAMNQAS